MIGSKYLTDPSPEQMLTEPGQADFAIREEKRTCDGCLFWTPNARAIAMQSAPRRAR